MSATSLDLILIKGYIFSSQSDIRFITHIKKLDFLLWTRENVTAESSERNRDRETLGREGKRKGAERKRQIWGRSGDSRRNKSLSVYIITIILSNKRHINIRTDSDSCLCHDIRLSLKTCEPDSRDL